MLAVAENFDGSSEFQPLASSFMSNETSNTKRSSETSAMLRSISVTPGLETTPGSRASQFVQAGATEKEIQFKESDGRGLPSDGLEMNVEVTSSTLQNGGNDFDDLQSDDDQIEKDHPENKMEETIEENIELVSFSPDVQDDADTPYFM